MRWTLPLAYLGCALVACAPAAAPPSPTPSTRTSATIRGTGAETTTHRPSPPERRSEDRARCESGDAQGCHAAGLDAFYRPSDAETDRDALRFFTRGCELGYAPACNGLGVLHSQGRGVPPDPEEAARLYRLACEAGASTACQHLAAALRRGDGVPVDPEAADRADARHACASGASLGRGSLEGCPAL